MFVILEGTHRSVFGPSLKQSELEVFFGKHLEKYELNDIDDDAAKSQMWNMELPYIAKSSATFLTKWPIGDIGTIPRWSKWSAVLDAYHAGLYAQYVSKTKKLSDY